MVEVDIYWLAALVVRRTECDGYLGHKLQHLEKQ